MFDGNSWSLGTIPTPRQLLAGAPDGKLLYTVSGTTGDSDQLNVEAYDPVAKSWTTLPPLPQARSISAWPSSTASWWPWAACPAARSLRASRCST
ncbi:Kelch repeat-containing protein [Mycobacterium tilburgii]|uniref:Kelch repeat-containing protein n=1 Tax=Mycobacterium tilburgii TaxID=44467 RepID=UPI00118417C9